MSAPPVVELKTRPWRHYTLDGETHVDGVKIASVTQVLGVIDKSGPLQHYAAQKTLEGVCAAVAESRAFCPSIQAVRSWLSPWAKSEDARRWARW